VPESAGATRPLPANQHQPAEAQLQSVGARFVRVVVGLRRERAKLACRGAGIRFDGSSSVYALLQQILGCGGSMDRISRYIASAKVDLRVSL
jgi:hypothetical protein